MIGPDSGITTDGNVTRQERRGLERSWLLQATLVFLLFFVAYNRGTYLVLRIVLRGERRVPSNLGDLASAGVPLLESFQLDSDSLIAGRLFWNITQGVFADWPFLRTVDGNPYLSQVGLGGWLMTMPPTVIHSDGVVGLAVMYCVAAALSALLATWSVMVVQRALGALPAVAVAVALLQPWIVAMAGSIYWLIGLKILPAALLSILLRRQKLPFWLTSSIVGLVTIVALASGYEFATIVFAMPLGVLTFLAVHQGWPLRRSMLRALAVAGSQIAAFAVTLGFHYLLLSRQFGGRSLASSALLEIVTKRTGASGAAVDDVYAASLQSSPMDVLNTYLAMPLVGAPLSIPLVGVVTTATFLVIGVVVLPLVRYLPVSHDRRRLVLALGLAWLVTLLGPVGWYLLARPHSYIHTHINFTLWFLPTIPLGVAYLYQPAAYWLRTLMGQRMVVVPLGLGLAIVVLMLLLSLATVR